MALRAGGTPVLPFGAYEQHGAHLPLATDTIIAVALATRVADAIGGVVLPAVAYGQTSGNDGFPGTLSLSFDTVRAIATDLASAVQRAGARCLVIVNGDYGNRSPLRLAAWESQQRNGFPVLIVNYPGMDRALEAVCETAAAGFGLHHADEFETSIVLALNPTAADMERAVAEYPTFPPDFPDVDYPLHELSTSGVFGDATAATADKGERLLGLLGDAATHLVRSFLSTHPPAA